MLSISFCFQIPNFLINPSAIPQIQIIFTSYTFHLSQPDYYQTFSTNLPSTQNGTTQNHPNQVHLLLIMEI